MALPKSLYLISTSQSDLFPMLMGLPVLAHVGAWEGMGWLCRFCSFCVKETSKSQTDTQVIRQTHTHTVTQTQVWHWVTEQSTFSSHLAVYYEKPGSSQAIMTCYIPFLASWPGKTLGRFHSLSWKLSPCQRRLQFISNFSNATNNIKHKHSKTYDSSITVS